MSKFCAVILAAGQGTRMKSNLLKVMHRVSNKPLIEWVYDACSKAGSEKTVMVIGHNREQVIAHMGEDKTYAVQEERLGTGHAVLCAKPAFSDYAGTIVVLNGDTPLLSEHLIRSAVAHHEQSGNRATVITAVLDDPAGYGRIVKDADGNLLKIVEKKDATEAETKIAEINSGMYCFDAKALFMALKKVGNNNAQGEYYLTDTISVLKSEHQKVGVYTVSNPDEILGVNDRMDLAAAQKIKNAQILEKHMKNGVTIIDPNNTYIDEEVEIGQDTVVYPNSFLKGESKIGKNCEIGPGANITNTKIGDGVKFLNSVAVDAKIGTGTTVGPFAYIRPKSDIGEKVKIGDFVEVKNSVIGNGTKISHLTYVGDSDVGQNINFGCGTITVNYDGKNKFRTVIEDNAFIGCNTNLVAPVKVNKNAFIAAGSTITEDVDADSLAIARCRQTVKKDWRKNKK